MARGGSPTVAHVTAAEGAITLALGGGHRGGFLVQNLSTTAQVTLGPSTVVAGVGVILAARPGTGDQPNGYQDSGSDGEWYAVAAGGTLDLSVTTIR